METIDELVPLTEADIKKLQSASSVSTKGCGIFFLVVFLITGILTLWLATQSFLLALIVGVISLLSLLVGLFGYFSGPSEKEKNAVLDLQEGKKRRIVAPIEMKDLTDVTNNKIAFSMQQQIRNSYKELEFKYFMMVKGYKFDLSEEQYLAGARKGDFVEFYVAPHSGVILSEPVEVRE